MLPELRFRIIVVMQLIRNKSILEKMSSNTVIAWYTFLSLLSGKSWESYYMPLPNRNGNSTIREMEGSYLVEQLTN